MTDLADPLDHFLAAKAAAVAALDELERLLRAQDLAPHAPAIADLSATIRGFADETATLNKAIAEAQAEMTGDAA